MKRRIFRARISLSFVNFNFLERNRELSLNNRERTIGKPINQISIDISFEPGIYSSHSVAPDKNRGGKLRGNIETGVSIIAAKMSDGVSAHASVCALGSYVARPLKKKNSNLTRFWKTRRPSLLKTVYSPMKLAIQRNVIFIYQSWTGWQQGTGGGEGKKGWSGRERKKKNETKEGKKRKRKRGGEGEKNSSIFSGVKLFFY